MTPAERIRAALDAADEGGYGPRAWYSYMSRHDIEAVLREAERVPALVAGLRTLEALLRPRRPSSPHLQGRAVDIVVRRVAS